MTPSPGKVPQRSGHFEIRVLHSQERGYRPAMSLVLSGSPLWSEEVAEQVENLESLARRQNLRMDLLVGAYSPVELVSAALAIESPGRTAMAYTPAGDPSGEERRAMVEVLRELQRCVWRRGVTVLQALLPPDDRARPGIHASAGFRYLAELIHMDRPIRLATHKFKPVLRLRMVTYRPDRRQLFLRALEESYVESLDCPGLAGLRQTDLKYVIGYSSVSHMGIVGLGLSTVSVDGLNGAIFQMFAHGVMTALFFSSVGYVYDRTHTKAIDELGGLSRIMPVASTYFIVAAMASMGIPCLASFWGELVVFISAFKVYPFHGVMAVAALVISALFMLRVVQKTFYGPQNTQYEQLPDVPFRLGIPRMILIVVLVFFGLFPSLLFDVIDTATIPFINGLP